MVEAEERKIKQRKDAVKHQEEEDNKNKSKESGPKQGSGKAAKDKIIQEHKSAGKVDNDEAEEKERNNMEAQNEKEGNARKHAEGDGAKVKGRGEVA